MAMMRVLAYRCDDAGGWMDDGAGPNGDLAEGVCPEASSAAHHRPTGYLRP